MRDASTRASELSENFSVETPSVQDSKYTEAESRYTEAESRYTAAETTVDGSNASSISKRIKKINKIFANKKEKKEKKPKKEKKDKKKDKKDKKKKKKDKKKRQAEEERGDHGRPPRPEATETEDGGREPAPSESENLMIPYLPSRRKDTIKSYEADNEMEKEESRTGEMETTTEMESTMQQEETITGEETTAMMANSFGDHTADTECNYSAPARMQDMANFYPLVLPEPLAAAAVKASRQAPWSPPPPPPKHPAIHADLEEAPRTPRPEEQQQQQRGAPPPPPRTPDANNKKQAKQPASPKQPRNGGGAAASVQTEEQTALDVHGDHITETTGGGDTMMSNGNGTIFGTPWCTMQEFWNSIIFLDEATHCTHAWELANGCKDGGEVVEGTTTTTTKQSDGKAAAVEGTVTTNETVIKGAPRPPSPKKKKPSVPPPPAADAPATPNKEDGKLMAPTLLGALVSEGGSPGRPVPVPLDNKQQKPTSKQRQQVAADKSKPAVADDAQKQIVRTNTEAGETAAPDIPIDAPTGAPTTPGDVPQKAPAAAAPVAPAAPAAARAVAPNVVEEEEPTGYTDSEMMPSEYQEQGILILSSDGMNNPTYSALTNEEEYTYLTDSQADGTTVGDQRTAASKAKSSKRSKKKKKKNKVKEGEKEANKSGAASAAEKPDSVAERLKAARNKVPPKELSQFRNPTAEEEKAVLSTAEFLTSRKEAQMKEMERLKARRRHFKNMQKPRGDDEIERARLNQAFSSDEEEEEDPIEKARSEKKTKKKKKKKDKKAIPGLTLPEGAKAKPVEEDDQQSLGAMIKDALNRADRTIDFVLENNYNDYGSDTPRE